MPPTAQNKDFQKRVFEKVLQFSKKTEYDEGQPKFSFPLNGRISKKEVKKAMTKAESGKTPSDDEILNEMLKKGGDKLVAALTLLMNLMWSLEVTAPQWKNVIIVPIYKKASYFDPKNYRPISLLSNLFKLYERIIDTRIRAVIHIIEEQCGFRAAFGTDTALLRLYLLMLNCKANNKGLWLGFLDLEQAFERAWRVGILYQLWIAGVRGKCWRVVSIILNGITGFVRTNFGDTPTFRLSEGVLQGSVLAAILFLIFINPLIDALRPHSPVFNNTPFPPQLFADDLTIAAASWASRTKLIELTIAWSIRWKSSIGALKSPLLTTNPAGDNAETRVWGKVFKEMSKVFHLGLGINREGVYTVAHVHSKLTKLTDKLRTITDSGIFLGGIVAEAGIDLFQQSALSVISYVFSLCHPRSRKAMLLDGAQIEFANRFLGLPKDTPGSIGKSELGLIDIRLRVARSRLLLLHRIVNNKHDCLTNKMLTWPLDRSGGTFMSECENILRELDPGMPLSFVLQSPYIQASYALKRATQLKQQDMWLDEAENLPAACAWHAAAKRRWGLDTIITDFPPEVAKTFIHFRAGLISPKLRINPISGLSACVLCNWTTPQSPHILWQCPATSVPRALLGEQLPQPILARLKTMTPDEASKAMMGGGENLSHREWLLIAPIAVAFIKSIADIIRGTVSSDAPDSPHTRPYRGR